MKQLPKFSVKKGVITLALALPMLAFAQTDDQVICVGNFVPNVGLPAPGGTYGYSLINLSVNTVAVDLYTVQTGPIDQAGAPANWIATTYPMNYVEFDYLDSASGDSFYPLAQYSTVSGMWYTSPEGPVIDTYTITDEFGNEYTGYVVTSGNTTPVELSSFNVDPYGNGARVSWVSIAEDAILGYNLYRDSIKLNSEVILGSEFSDYGQSYTFTDNVKGSEYSLMQVNYAGEETLLANLNLENLPADFELKQNYPNPFNPDTKISYSLTEGAHVDLVVYNALGVQVAELVDNFVNAGEHTVDFSADDLSSGTYFYKITVGDQSLVKSMTLVK